MLKPIAFFLPLFTVTVAALHSQARPSHEGETAAKIIAMERAALERGDPDAFLEISEPEVTYFDPELEQPIHGLEALRAYYHSFPASEPSSGTMTNAKVQVSGNVAVLTFNYTSRTSRRVVRWNATEVYRQGINGWRIIHTHWSYLKPQLAK